jgi:UDP-GlcNAc:undecaprenyl-phosphate/decaprenyl-phosphate GlcNAc-1-phosphate transferase
MTALGACFLAALGLSAVLTPACRAAARRLGFVATPRLDRWGGRPTALLGGVAIVATVFALAPAASASPKLWQLLSAGGVIAAVGLIDDVFSLKASTKLVAQVSVACLLLFFGYRLNWTTSIAADAMLTLLWIVGITNAFNLLDNMDGLCTGIVLIAGGCLLLGSTGFGLGPQDRYLAILLGASAGFLLFNVHPASIFLGDTGSLFLGVNIAALTLAAQRQGPGRPGLISAVAVPVLLLLIPIFDTTFVTIVRLLSGRRPSQGGRDHTSHRLVAIGLSESRAVVTLWVLAAGGGVISRLVSGSDPSWPLVAALTLVLAMVIFAVYLARIRVYPNGELAALHAGSITPLVANFMYKRRVAEILLDLCLIPLAYYAAYRLRFEGPLFAANYPQFIESLPIVLTVQLVTIFAVGGYRGTWRYFGLMDAVVTAKGVIIGTLATQLVLLYLFRFADYSRAVFVIDAAILLLLHTVSRASFRLIGEFARRRRGSGPRVIIYGAGEAGSTAIRALMGESGDCRIAGFVDDDEGNWGRRVHGYVVLGSYRALGPLIASGDVDRVVISAAGVPEERVSDLEQHCAAFGVGLSRLTFQMEPLVAANRPLVASPVAADRARLQDVSRS